MPQFLSDLYDYDTLLNDDVYCIINATNRSDYCAQNNSQQPESSYLAFFYTAAVFFAIGSNPLFVYGIAYIDDSTHYARAAFYIGI